MSARSPRALALTRRFLTFAFWTAASVAAAAAVVFIALNFAPDRATLSPHLDPTVTREAALRAARWGAAGVSAASLLLLPILRLLRQLVDSAVAGDPFVPANSRRLRRLAWLILGVDVVVQALTVPVSLALHGSHAPLGMPVSFTGMLTVMMTLVLAHVFEQGSRLRADVQGTV